MTPVIERTLSSASTTAHSIEQRSQATSVFVQTAYAVVDPHLEIWLEDPIDYPSEIAALRELPIEDESDDPFDCASLLD